MVRTTWRNCVRRRMRGRTAIRAIGPADFIRQAMADDLVHSLLARRRVRRRACSTPARMEPTSTWSMALAKFQRLQRDLALVELFWEKSCREKPGNDRLASRRCEPLTESGDATESQKSSSAPKFPRR